MSIHPLARLSLVLCVTLLVAAVAVSPVALRAQGAPALAAYSVEATPIGVLLDDPRARAVLDANVSGFSKDPQFSVARTMTLRAVQPFAPERLTDAALAKIDTQLKALPTR